MTAVTDRRRRAAEDRQMDDLVRLLQRIKARITMPAQPEYPIVGQPWEGTADGLLVVACWCQARWLAVPQHVVAQASTGSCGADHCYPQGDTHG